MSAAEIGWLRAVLLDKWQVAVSPGSEAGNLTYPVHVFRTQFPGIGSPAEIKSSLKIYSIFIIYLCRYQLSFLQNV